MASELTTALAERITVNPAIKADLDDAETAAHALKPIQALVLSQ